MTPAHRPITAPGWALGVVFLPAGFFLALATGRVISWTKAVAWFLLYIGLTLGFARGMAHLEEANAGIVVQQLFLHLGVGVFSTELFLIYHYGRRAGYWTSREQKSWRVLAILFSSLYFLQVVSIMVQIVVIPF
ncbi:hypothetical protein [Prosthecobacter sp.]|uniref:hypothetical protein n=1 Tax=Prosthecobacter sp. TaxID=1965333 RepID=UPI0037850E25